MQLWRSAALGLAVAVVIAGPAQAGNGVPVVSGATIAATEGAAFDQTVASVTDDPLKNSSCAPASDYTATLTWGDGSAADTGTVVFVSGPDSSNLCHYTVGGGHTYAEEGDRPLSISVTGPNSATPGAGTGAAEVADAPLSASAPATQSATSGSPFSGTVATFQDADAGGAVADYTAQVNWGDGTSSTATASAASGGFTATASHTWSAAGAYTVSTTVADTGGATTSTSFTVNVASAGSTTTTSSPPPGFRVSLSGPTSAVPLGSAARFTAQATPPPGTTVVAYRWRLQGSGAYNVDTGSNPQLSHRFTAGTHTVSMEAIASDGSVSSPTGSHVITTQTVANLACIHDLPAGWIEILDPGCIIVHQPPRSSHAITARVPHSSVNRAPGPGTGQGSTPQGLYYQIPIPTAGITLNGLEVQCPTNNCTMTISPDYNFPHPEFGTRDFPYFLSTNKPVRLIMPNTMNGPVTLGNAQLAFEFVGLPYRDVASIPFQSVAIPAGTRFGDSVLSGLADIAIVRPTDTGPSYSVTFDLDIALFGQSFRHPTTIQGSSTGDVADAPGDWSIDLSGLPIPPLVIFNSLQISYQDHVDTPPGYMGVPLDHVLSGSGSAEVILTGDEVGAAMIVANGTPIYVHFSYDAGNGAVGAAPGGGGGSPGSGGAGSGETPATNPAEGLASIDHLDATFRSDPYFEIAGGLTLSVAQYKAGGFVHYTAPYGSTPFQLYLGATFPIVFPGLNGTVAVDITGDPDPGFGVSGQIAYSLDPWLDVNAALYMYVAWGHPNEIEFGISAGLKVLGIHIASGQGFVNQSWIAGCGVLFDVIQGWGVAPIAPGVGPGDGGWGGCSNIAPYSDAPELAGLSSVRGHAAAAGHYIQVTHHLSWANVKVTSAAGTPSVVVDGPGVHAVSSTAEGAHYAGGVGTIVKSTYHTLVLGLHTPRLGRYTITAAPGSPPLTAVQSSLAVAPEIRARLTGHGENRTLHYTIAHQPGQRVILTERSRHGFQRLAAITGGGQGSVAFHPGQFGGRARTIIALPSLDGMPQGAVTVAHYTAPPPLRPAAPAHLRLTYRARTSSVLASWRDRGAFRYRVVISATDGRRLIVFTRRSRLTIGTVFPGARVSLTVRGQTGMLRYGPARSTHLRVASRSRHRPPRQRRR